MNAYRSHNCGALRKADIGKKVRLSGWVNRVRDHGGLLFIDLRDHYGLTQIIVNPSSAAFATANIVRSEWVIRVEGEVKARSGETINPALPTGEVEIFAGNIDILSRAEELPLPVFGEPDYPEDIRLKYRFLDLRRETLHKNIVRRTQIIAAIRRLMTTSGFTEYSTPILTASSPEGARDFLVPSRLHAGRFYALPQAPQQYKQLLMMSGFDRYFQIAPCFRDEDPRADRLPGEFYQLDVEMSFVEQEDVFAAIEPVMRAVFKEFGEGKAVPEQFPRIPYDEAMRKYGSDKPDLRNPIMMENVSAQFRDSGFKVFANILAADKQAEIWAIPAKGGGSRAFCDRMNAWAQKEGQPGLGYIFWREEEGVLSGVGPLAKNLGAERTENLRRQLQLAGNDACFFCAGRPQKFVAFAGAARNKLGEELGLIDESRFALAWIVDFPFYEWNEEEKRIEFSHNPFSMPQGGIEALETSEPLAIKAWQYDIVCNGFEIASGGIRNHLPETMVKAFAIAGLSRTIVEERFGGLYRAFHYGAPPHGGVAAGIDRIVMLLTGARNLREISLFPMNQQAADLLMGAPSEVNAAQLRDLHIRLMPGEKK
ncbi:MAG: aspartate--tRNA ligase [Candidatus Tokpelaia sp.]|uniref:aspartate--tRNA ligase n=1 Tax=Candidatus Tokpelaia sp. TaxID=2233777 RepID=UPI00123AC213|nr:aspartate--tRNA ligase [Candidatus Tokpelaia sp.]KAA6204887.1 MAG: aspartate--tRNA ligase [Candidatus Tokpelaia sp.]KAA6207804.1 MAG: aspartate--tRNA ligase [Candidatus Tokpelaia sp.]KAA6404998.1 aspartate--tRNA ligase [Candidatus Tokpelaia sp.]